MPKLGKNQFKKIKKSFSRLPRILAERAFLTSLVLFLIAMILGALAFYKYIILVEQKEPQVSERPLRFDEKNMQNVLKVWQDRQQKFDEADSKQYLNPFKVTE